MSANLQVEIRAAGEESVVQLAGELDMACAPELQEAVAELRGKVVVDLGSVTYLDSSGLAVLVGARNRLRSEGGDLTLRNPRDIVGNVLRVVGFTDWME